MDTSNIRTPEKALELYYKWYRSGKKQSFSEYCEISFQEYCRLMDLVEEGWEGKK